MSSPSHKLIYLFDWPLLASLLVLLAIGLVNLYSAAEAGGAGPFFSSQMMWTALGLVGLFFMLSFHYRGLLTLAVPIYLLSLFLLMLVPFFGATMGGQKNWLAVGPFRMQPSELAKFSLVLLLARHFALHPLRPGQGLKSLAKPILFIGLPLGLILIERDLGAALFFVLIGLSFFYFAGVRKRIFVGFFLLLVLTGVGGYRFFLQDYQKARIQTFLHPERDPRGKGYHLLQSKIAVGSGGISGKGYLQGHLHKFKFLPEQRTDFVFPVLAEEWGFIGSLVVLSAYGFFFLLLMQAAGKVQEPFGSLLISGVAAWLFWQWVWNLGGVLGLLPLAGVTLPFMSYGGSSLLTNLLAMGLVLNVYMRRYMF